MFTISRKRIRRNKLVEQRGGKGKDYEMSYASLSRKS
jgi:hypothetical protein